MWINPLEQFEVYLLNGIKIFGWQINNSQLVMGVVSLIIYMYITILFKRNLVISNNWQTFNESLYTALYDLLKQQVGKKGIKYYAFYLLIFLFILVCNLLGLLPYSFTVTSQFIVTSILSISIFIGLIIIGLNLHKLHFFHLFVPQGISKVLLPFLVVIEVISYLIRPLSLSIRLFANMLAGHTLLHIIASFVFFLSNINYIIWILPFLFLFAIIVLECAIAFIQAYVFFILICIYLNDSINLH